MNLFEKIKNKNRFKLFEPVMILVFWVLLFASPVLLGDSDDALDWDHLLRVWSTFIPYLVLFLINRYLLLPFLFFKNKRGLFIMSVIVLILGMSLLDYAIQENRLKQAQKSRMEMPQHRRPEFMPLPPNGGHSQRGIDDAMRPPDLPPKQLPPFVSFMLISFLVVGFDTGLVLSIKWVNSEQKRMKAETENVQNQLAFLRNQVSPHFFMNTLNNIHALIDIDTEEAKESILRLSKLMRHLLYDSEIDKIPVKKEIEFIQNYVDLMRMRYADQVKIQVKIIHNVPEKEIPPLLFTSFVENAFKHGISYQQQSYVDIMFTFEEGKLMFVVKNSKANLQKADESSGIGVENSRKRLDLLYANNYELKIQETKTDFSVTLNIPL